MSQFNNLEGRNTFNEDNGYEKVKIVNGGIPQNSDLNEQSSIDEARARAIVKEGFGSGKVAKGHFSLAFNGSTDLRITKPSTSDILGILWQDGYRLRVTNTSDLTIATNLSAAYKQLKTTGVYKGNVYIIHAKEDFLDPNDRLTVRDLNDVNLIQVDTAVREKRVYDFYIDWGVSGADAPAIIRNDESGILSDASGGLFEGKTPLTGSSLDGYEGHVFFIGTISQTEGGASLADIAQSRVFNGVSGEVRYTGGDTSHQRDTEVCGLVYVGDGDPDYSGLKAVDAAATGSAHSDIDIGGVLYDVTLPKLSISATQLPENSFEQLHIPALTIYAKLDAALTGNEVAEDLAVDGFTTVDEAITAIMATFPASLNEGNVSDSLLLYVSANNYAGLDNISSYRLRLTDLDSVAPTASEFPIAYFKLVITAKTTSPNPNRVTLGFVSTDTAINYLYDRRRYFINAEQKIAASPTMEMSLLENHILRTEGSTGISTNNKVRIGGSFYTVVSFDSATQFLSLTLDSGSVFPLVGTAIYHYSGGVYVANGTVKEILVDPRINTYNTQYDMDFDVSTTLPHQTVSTQDGTDVIHLPKTISSMFAQIRGVLRQLVIPTSGSNPTKWLELARVGLRLNKFASYLHSSFSPIWKINPPAATYPLEGAVDVIQMLSSGTANKEGSIQIINLSRTLRDGSNGILPFIKMQGSSGIDTDFAPFIDMYHLSGTHSFGAGGAMVIMRGKNGLIACPISADPRTLFTGSNLTGVILDGEEGKIKLNIIDATTSVTTPVVVATTSVTTPSVVANTSVTSPLFAVTSNEGRTKRINEGVFGTKYLGTFTPTASDGFFTFDSYLYSLNLDTAPSDEGTQFDIKYSGIYRVTASCFVEADVLCDALIQLYIDGFCSPYSVQFRTVTPASGGYTKTPMSFDCLVPLAAGDAIKLYYYNSALAEFIHLMFNIQMIGDPLPEY